MEIPLTRLVRYGLHRSYRPNCSGDMYAGVPKTAWSTGWVCWSSGKKEALQVRNQSA